MTSAAQTPRRAVPLPDRAPTAQEPEMRLFRKRPTFAAIASRWLKMHSLKVTASTTDTYKRMLDYYLVPVIGARPVGSITRADVKALAAGMLERGLSAGTVRIVLHVAVMVFDDAEDDELIAGNPARKVAEKVLPKEREDDRPAKAMTADQLAIFLGVARQTEPAYYPALALMARTGLRISECLALSWADVDLVNRRLTVRRSKNGRPRTIPLTADMTEMLAGMAQGSGLVFSAGRATCSVRRAIKRILKAASLPEHWSCHSLRHSWASVLDQQGADLSFISRLAGHSGLQMTRHYAHNLPATGWSVVDRLMSAVPIVLPPKAAPDAESITVSRGSEESGAANSVADGDGASGGEVAK
jgi:integrase